ncbi:MAG: adenylosuccinate lyase [Actinobacteria bacterium]|nr:adenylosuccinate lyase [Actinomycetota bacterium]
MIPRYSLPEMSNLFSDAARMARWLEVELLAVEGWASIGRIPEKDAFELRHLVPAVDEEFCRSVARREQVTNHDVAAFVDVVQAAVAAPCASWFHYGMTSSDVVDTALGATLLEATDLLITALRGLRAALKRKSIKYMHTPIAGRTHGMFAEPTTFGAKLALLCLQVDRDVLRLRRARENIAVGKLSGAVGTYSNIDPRVESYVCSRLGLVPVPASQVVARDRHAEVLWACASAAASVEAIATEVRLLHRSEVGEVQESFGSGQKGSSAMPHKRNPILSERLCGIARVLRGYVVPGLEDIALWHERDISHSSVERVILPDACQLAYYSFVKCTELVENLVVQEQRMMDNLMDRSLGLVFSQSVLLELVESGAERNRAYRIVQRDAALAVERGKTFREVLEEDGEVNLESDSLDRAFSLERLLLHMDRFAEALKGIGDDDDDPVVSSGGVDA